MVLWTWQGLAGWFWLEVCPEVTVKWYLMLESSKGSPGLDVQGGFFIHLSWMAMTAGDWLSISPITWLLHVAS